MHAARLGPALARVRGCASRQVPPTEFILGHRLIEARIDSDLALERPETAPSERRHRYKAHHRHAATGNDHLAALKRGSDQLGQVGRKRGLKAAGAWRCAA